MIEPGDYGLCVLDWDHWDPEMPGRLVFYDDDGEDGYACVYHAAPLIGHEERVPRSVLFHLSGYAKEDLEFSTELLCWILSGSDKLTSGPAIDASARARRLLGLQQ